MTGLDLLLTKYRPALVGEAMRTTHNRADAEDVVQEVMLTAWKLRDNFDGGAPWAWLTTILRNRLLNYVTKKKTPPVEPLDIDPDTDPTPEETVLAREAIRDCLALLTHDEAQAVALHYLEGIPVLKVAERLGITAHATRKRLSRGRVALTVCMTINRERKRICSPQ